MDKQELIKLLEIANQRLRHVHDALWKEETHYTWLVYILAAGVVFVVVSSEACGTVKTIIASVLSLIGILVCLFAYSAVRKEGRFFHTALQIRNRLNFALDLNNFTLNKPYEGKKLLPNDEVEVKDWKEVECKANKSLKELLKGIFRPSSIGIRGYFQLTLLLPIPLFLVMLLLSITLCIINA